jgi:predicted lipoprotein with Yx(FWY)xxD motif
MKTISILLAAGLLALAGCGDDDESGTPKPAQDDAAMQEEKDDAAMQKEKAAGGSGTAITVADSEFGPMLFDTKKQAIYIFENDPKGESVCYDQCAEAWPPVFTKGEPRATGDVKESLLGTVKRRDGKLQVTYAGKPLYYYDHEGPGEVRCHNVDLNGGLWWVVGPDGERRP